MKVLGIECTAHTLGIGVYDSEKDKILANEINTYKPPKGQGMLPRELADHHAVVFGEVLKGALEKSNCSLLDIDIFAFSQGPGIGAPLSVGCAASKYLSLKYKKPLVGVNHCHAHVEITRHISGFKDPLVLYLSGGNSQIIIKEKKGYHILGETLDIGLGNLFDSFARSIGIEGHGSALESFSKGGKYIELPYSVKGMNLVFSGLLTQAQKIAKEKDKKDVAFSLMETAFAMSCEATERALFLTKKKQLLVCGGVAQNKRLQEMLRTMCEDDGVEFAVAPDEYNRDNGAMIAYTGFIMRKKAKKTKNKIKNVEPLTNFRIDQVKL
ncbi:MAG: KEOPS complex N(6)-L-threonylcarbamoyladenine synthase Kae1 [Candidatus Bilamarchaeaceae archaeon]